MNNLTMQESESLDDPEWDAFVERSSLGQYQQSAAWARFKGMEGWSCSRVVLRGLDGSIAGGFQVLWKQSRFGRIAYLSKGPVCISRKRVDWHELKLQLKALCSRLAIRALIQQLPDETPIEIVGLFEEWGCLPCSFMGVIDCSIWVNAAQSVEALSSSYRASTRKHRNKGRRGGLKGEWGSRRDLPQFFELMLKTCERQQVAPNPSSLRSIEALWDAFDGDGGGVKLRMTRLEGRLVCADLSIAFGDRLTLFKTGWNGEANHLRPKFFHTCDILDWASCERFGRADFLSFDRNLGEVMLAGGEIREEHKARRDFFKSFFGGEPVFLPQSTLWIPNPFLRYALKVAIKAPLFSNVMKKLVLE